MIIRKHRPDQGICFAWLPKWTPDGTVWLEWVHFRHSNDGLDLHPWRYARWMPQDRYDAGERAQTKSVRPCTCPDNMIGHEEACRHFDKNWELFHSPRTETDAQGRRYFGYQPRGGYATPPDISKCGKLQPDGPTPCHYPHCTCMDVGGSSCPT